MVNSTAIKAIILRKWIYFVSFLAFLSLGANQKLSLDDALNQYWESKTTTDKEKAVKQIVAINPAFDDLYGLLRKGKKYTSKKSGFINVSQSDPLLPPHALVVVPNDYSPENKYPVRVYLHGAVSNMDPDFLYRYTVDTLSDQLLKSKAITIFPTAWYLSPWWSEAQFKNVNRLVNWVKENYNVNENMIRLGGVSDGGIGSYYFANCDQTTWSSVTPFIGSLRALNKVGDRQVYMNNFKNTSLLIVNTGRDNTFNLALEKPFVKSLMEINDQASFIEVDSSGHSMAWYPELKDSIDSFVELNPRSPYPDQLTWQTDDVVKYNRFRYLIIEKLGKTKTGGDISDFNTYSSHGSKNKAFKRDKASGIVELHKEGNVVRVKTSGVKKYKLLLSPDHFDFQKPIVIYTNNEKSFEGLISTDIKTLLKWNLNDIDRQMLFGAELGISVN